MLRHRRVRRSPVTISARWLRREIAVGLIVLLVTPFGGSASAFAQQTAPGQQVGGVSSSQPDSRSSETEKPAGSTSPAQDNDDRQPNGPKTASGQEGGSQPPLGTAVAPYEKGIGIAASRPAGAVIAPAKQRRTRSFAIKLGVLIGAGVAVGTVVALSNASPSRPH